MLGTATSAIGRADRTRIRQDHGDLTGALEDITFSIDWNERQRPVNEPGVAFDYEGKAVILAEMGRFSEARAAIDESVRLRIRVFGPDHKWTAITVRRRRAIHEGRRPG